jgi:hypothetical protein
MRPASALIAAILPLAAQSVTVEQPVRTLHFATRAMGIYRFEHLVSWNNTFTALGLPEEHSYFNATLVRLASDGTIAWEAELGSDQADDLAVTPSGGAIVLLQSTADDASRLVFFDANGKRLSSDSGGKVAKIALLGGNLYGLDYNGNIERLADRVVIGQVPAPDGPFHYIFLAAGPKTLAVADTFDGKFYTLNVETGAEQAISVNDPEVEKTRQLYRSENVKGTTIAAAAGFDGGLFLMPSGFSIREAPVLVVDLNGRTRERKWLQFNNGPFFVDFDPAGTLNILERDGKLSSFALKP